MNCHICGNELRTGDRILRHIQGWEEKRSQGGANKIIQRQPTGQHAHKWCVQGHREQEQLL